MAKVIILNGPPGVGKDTLANLINESFDYPIVSFKQPMFNIARAMLGEADFDIFIEAYSDRAHKDSTHLSILGGMTCREFMIWISEDVIKPKLGKSHFGYLMHQIISSYKTDKSFICSDGGFMAEVENLIDEGHEVKLIRLHRDGFDFTGDSRSHIYLDPKYIGVNGYAEHDVTLDSGYPDIALRAIADLVIFPESINHDFSDDIPW